MFLARDRSRACSCPAEDPSWLAGRQQRSGGFSHKGADVVGEVRSSGSDTDVCNWRVLSIAF